MVTRSPNPLAVVKLSWETIKPTYGQNRYEPPYDPDNRYEHAGDGIIASTILLSVDTSVGGAETMSIMSVSLPDPLVQQMDTLTKERGFAGRSDFVRAAVREFVQQLVSDPMRSGRRSATITLLYPEALERRVAEVAHDQSKVITSMMHANAGRGRCVTVYIAEGDAGGRRESTILFLHGYPTWAEVWLPLAGRLGGRRPWIAPDLPCHNQSGTFSGKDRSVSAYRRAIRSFFDAMQLEKAIIIGSSLGGTLGIMLALDRPDKVDRLVVLDSAGLTPTMPKKTVPLYAPFVLPAYVRHPRAKNVRRLLERAVFHDPRYVDEAWVQTIVEQWTPGARRAAFIATA